MRPDNPLFIRSADRPDLRAPALERDDLTAGSAFSTFPRSYLFSGCNEKEDTKKDGKDDKSHRAPVKDRAMRAREGAMLQLGGADNAFATVFA